MNSLLKKTLRILLGKGAVALLSIAFTMYFAREFPKTIFAAIAIYDTIVSMSKVLVDLGFENFLIREATSQYYTEQRRKIITDLIIPATIARAMLATVVCVMYGILVLGFESPLQSQFPEFDIRWVLWLTTFHLLLENFQSILTPIFTIKQRFGTHSFLTAATPLVEQIAALLCYVQGGTTFYFLGLVIGQMTTLIFRLFYVRNIFAQASLHRIREFPWKKKILEYRYFHLRKFFRFGFVQGEYLIIPLLLPLQQLANYRLAKQASSVLKNYSSAFTDPLVVRLARTRDIKERQSYVKTYLTFTLPAPLLMLLLSPWVMAALGGDKYAAHWPILAVLCVAHFFQPLSALQFTILSVFGRGKDFLFRDVAGGVGGLAATTILILMIGEYGIAWGQLVSYVILYLVGRKFANQLIKSQQRPPT